MKTILFEGRLKSRARLHILPVLLCDALCAILPCVDALCAILPVDTPVLLLKTTVPVPPGLPFPSSNVVLEYFESFLLA